MRITILAVPDCPNAPVAARRITAALAGRSASVELVEVTEEAEAARLGTTGSPTILLDGVDPFVLLLLSPLLSALGRQLEGDGFMSVRGSPPSAAATCLVGTRGWLARQDHPTYVPHPRAGPRGH